MDLSNFLSAIPFLLLVCSVVALHAEQRSGSLAPLWAKILFLNVIVCLGTGALTFIGGFWIVVGYIATFYIPKIANPINRKFGYIGLGVYLLALGMKLLPGFNPLYIWTPIALGDSSEMFHFRYELSKPLAGLLIYAYLVNRAHGVRELKDVLCRISLWFPPAVVVIIAAFFIGFEFDVKIMLWAPIFMLGNLFLTVIAEEAFFKGFVQQPLQARFGNRYWILFFVAALFSFVHIPVLDMSLWKFYLIIWIAGVAYAWSFQRSGKVESSILTHLAVNTGHFFLFVYPLKLS